MSTADSSALALGTGPLREAGRLMTICNSCRYCEGLCAVFPAMEQRLEFARRDLNYLANLCHGCGACYDDCQYSPPHEFQVNVPQTLARVRAESYAEYAWPAALAVAFQRNGVAVTSIVILSVAAFLLGLVGTRDPRVAFASGEEVGAFYRLMPHEAMAAVFGTALLYSVLAVCIATTKFVKATRSSLPRSRNLRSIGEALHAASTLRYLDGGGPGCVETLRDRGVNRRVFHHLTAYGFMCCFMSTCIATLYHYVWGLEAPYALISLPVLAGSFGGMGLVIGTTGLLLSTATQDPMILDPLSAGMNRAFTTTLLLIAVSGLALLAFRATAAMEVLLALHLGAVFALFVTIPYGKFVHGIYRFAALVIYSLERPRRAA